jgi:hypothetical protein
MTTNVGGTMPGRSLVDQRNLLYIHNREPRELPDRLHSRFESREMK